MPQGCQPARTGATRAGTGEVVCVIGVLGLSPNAGVSRNSGFSQHENIKALA